MAQNKPRARDLGVPFDGTPGPFNAVTDVSGVLVGHVTLISGEGELRVGHGSVRTGVTGILTRGRQYDPVFAATYSLNGVGEMTGVIYIEESGWLEGPILFTNTHSVGAVHQAAIEWMAQHRFYRPGPKGVWGALPVVGETMDAALNDLNGFHVHREHVFEALDVASSGSVAEGNVGGGTGMKCYDFKGGVGTASRRLAAEDGRYTVGVLVQANHGRRPNLTIAGVPVGQEIPDLMPEIAHAGLPTDGSSILVAVATDAPLLPHQLKRLARRVPLSIARTGGLGEHPSGDIFLVFSTANPGAAGQDGPVRLEMLPNERMDALFLATVQATEEAIVNALVAAEAMSGVNGNVVHALPHDRLQHVLRKYNRLIDDEKR
mgnify:CR=1 FL=1